MSEDYILNINKDYIDTNGNYILGSNDVLAIYQYENTTVSGTEEYWAQDWNKINPIKNNAFGAEISEYSWQLGTNSSGTMNLHRFAGWKSDDFLKDLAVTSSGYHSPYVEDYLTNYRHEYGWETTTAVGNGAFAATMDMGAIKTINTIYMLPGWDTDYTKYIKDYRIGISDTGAENDYTIVTSGTTTSGSVYPIITELSPAISGRYFKIYVDSNWGSSSYTRVGKLSAFYDPDWSMFGFRNYNSAVTGDYASWSQEVDFTNIESLFFDLRAYNDAAYQAGEIEIKIGGNTLKQYDWSNTGAVGWKDTDYDGGWWTRLEEYIDVSYMTGIGTLEVIVWDDSWYRRMFLAFLDNFNVQPGWYTEGTSSTRGIKPEFPTKGVYIVSDREGVSILDSDTNDLWMRFEAGAGKALESAARDIYAENGRIYLATVRGLVIIDFVNNCVWKYTDTGVYYRMSIAKRNEYAFWFTDNLVNTLSSSDVYSVSGGYWEPPEGSPNTHNVVVGTSAGIDFIYDSGIKKSSFDYLVRKVRVYDNAIVYLCCFTGLSKVGVIEDFSLITSDSFDEQVVLFSDNSVLVNNSFTGSLGEQWSSTDGNLPLSFDGGVLTISGTKEGYGNTTIVQNKYKPRRGFTASIDIKIEEWPDRTQGGFHFGLSSGWPYYPEYYSDSDRAMMLSAVNGLDGVYIEDEKFDTKPDYRNWVQNFSKFSTQSAVVEDSSYKISGSLTGSYGTGYSIGPVLGSVRPYPSCPDFIAKVKVKFTDIYTPDTGRVVGIVFGVTDGQYLGEGSGINGLSMCVHGDHTSPNPAVYCVAKKTSNSGWTWDTTVTQALFSYDGTDAAEWHDWEISYDSGTDTLRGSVDGIFVGETTQALGANIGIVMGPVGNQTDNVTVYFKEFEIDFGEINSNQKKKYVLNSIDEGSWSRPTVSGSHLSGIPFYSFDGTPNADWHTWEIVFDGTTFSGSVDGSSIGAAPLSLDVGNQPKIFFSYDMPATASGTNKDTCVRVKNFNIAYNDANTVVSGTPNSFYLESGNYGGNQYNALYLATSSGIDHLMYLSSTAISGTPTMRNFYSIVGGGAGDKELIYGNIKACYSVEPESGVVGTQGLLYVGTSRYDVDGWERLQDRFGTEVDQNVVGLTCTTDAKKLILSYNTTDASSSYIYMKELDSTRSTGWYSIVNGQEISGFPSTSASRIFCTDLESDKLYFCGPLWFGVYDLNNNCWIGASTNIGTGGVYTGGGALFEDGELTSSLARAEIYLTQGGFFGVYLKEHSNWEWADYFYGYSLPLGTADPAIVYSDVDNSIYMLQESSSGVDNFFRMPLNTLIWSSALSDAPLQYNFAKGIYAFYRPYDESVYYVMRGADDSYGRKILRYDVKQAEWEEWGIDLPGVAEEYMTASYSYKEDVLYVTLGETSAGLYRYLFPKDSVSRFIYWDSEDGVLPENSYKARFNRVSFNSGHSLLDYDTFNNSDVGINWFECKSNTDTDYVDITEGSSSLNIFARYSEGYAKCMLCSPKNMLVCDFVAGAKIKINDVRKPSIGTNNSFILGVSDHVGPSFVAEAGGSALMGKEAVGVNGLWMVAYNDYTTTERYSLWKRESGTDTRYTSTAYELFSGTDATPSADYRDWRISYTHSTKTMLAYLDDVLLGSMSFSDDGLVHGAMVSVGAYCEGTSVSGTLDVDVKDFYLTTGESVSMVSNYLEITDSDLNGYNYYEKYDETVSSGTDFAYQIRTRVLNESVDSNVYITTLGSVEDGANKVLLAALKTGSRNIGLYAGGDPTDINSYVGVTTQDWSLDTTYNIVRESDTVKVYVGDEETPSISVSNDEYMPKSIYRRVSFGVQNPSGEDVLRHHFDGVASRVTVSGSWSLETDEPSSYYGSRRIITGNTSDYVSFIFNDTYGAADIYAFYSATSGRASDAPYTIYHSGVITLPVADGYATNPINTVYDNIDESGGSNSDTTTIDVNQTLMSNGALYNASGFLDGSSQAPSCLVYLGRYIDIEKVILTGNVGAGDVVDADTVVLKRVSYQPKATATIRIYNIGYTIGSTEMITDSDVLGAFSVIDMSQGILMDAYNEETSPSIVGSNINSLDTL